MEVESGERVRAQKANSSNNTSTSSNANPWLLSCSNISKKKTGEDAMNQGMSDWRERLPIRVEGKSQICELGKDTEKVQWEPPCRVSINQE